MSNREKVEIAFNLEVESRRALKGLLAVDNVLEQMFSRKDRLGDRFDDQAVKKFRNELNAGRTQLREMEKAFGSSKIGASLSKNFDQIKKADKVLRKALRDGEREIAAAVKSNDKDKEREVRKHWKRVVDEAQKGLDREQQRMRRRASKGDAAKYLKKQMETVSYYNNRRGKDGEPSQNKKDVAEAITEGFDALKGKDLLGVGKSGGKLGIALANVLGKRSFLKGEALSQKGKAKGGVMGAAMGASGEIMKSVGGLVATFGKLAPILSLAGSALSSFVLLLIDIEAKAKEMNKALLEGSATAGFMGANMGDAKLAAADLESTLTAIRKQATDPWENKKWGTNADDVIRATNAYAQQGITKDILNSTFKTANASSNEAAKSVGDFGSLARVSFGYSRMLGVSLQEITDFQAEMFTEMGSSLGDLRLEFARMTRDANESGIAANKFFGILRGVSADLSLYTTRLGQASAALKLIGKSMNPREAQKFLQTVTQSYAQMSDEDRIRATRIVGEGKMREIVGKDLESKTKKLYSEIAQATGATIEEIQSAGQASAKDGGKAMEAILNRTEEGKKKTGTLMGALSEINMDKNALQKGGLPGVAEAAGNMSLGASFDATKAQLARFGGKGKLKDMTGIQGYAARKAANVSKETVRAMAKIEDSIDRQKANLGEELEGLLAKKGAGTLSEAEAAKLTKLTNLGLTSKEAIDKADTSDIINSMEMSDQEALFAATEQRNYQQETSEYTRGVMELLQLAIDGIFESMYQVMLSIWETLSSMSPWGDPEKNALQKAVLQSRDPAMMKAFKESGGDSAKMKASLLGDRQAMAANPEMGAKIGGALNGDKDKLREALLGSGMFGSTFQTRSPNFWFPTMKGRVTKRAASEQGMATVKAIEGGKTYEQFLAEMSPEDRKTLNQKVMESLSAAQLVGMGAKPQSPTTGPASAKSVVANVEDRIAQLGAKEGFAAVPAKGTPTTSAPQQAKGTPTTSAPQQAAAPTTTASSPAMVPATPAEKDVMDTIDLQGKDTVRNLQDLWALMSQQGIKVNKSHLSNDWQPILKKAALEGVREALFEQAIYSSANPTALLDRMGKSGLDEVAYLASRYKPATARAEGGAVTGIANGMAVFAPPGEGLTSIGPGEKIVPSGTGSGAGAVHLHVNGIGGKDLANFLREKVAQGIYEYKSREKF